ncbi:MAG: redox-regulated ATPase YchF [Saprospiraceae bacterium]|nr:redox-regulated ATPase YchF [Saprospiraceae bacterium]
MGLKAGIVGLPNVGKSTLFNALTSAKALAANYPFATKEPNVGMITVPDPRLEQLAAVVKPKEVTPTTVEILDIAGLIKGASKGEGLGNQFLGNIREVDAIIHVIRCFDDDNVVHVDGSVDPVRDKEIIETELILKDIETVEKRLERLRKQAKTGKKEDQTAVEFAENLLSHLESGKAARLFEVEDPMKALYKDLFLLTQKPVMYVCNVDETAVTEGNQYVRQLTQALEGEQAEILLVSAAIEADIAELDSVEERMEFVQDMGLQEPGVNRLIRATYHLLDLITFFTAGPKEVRAWTVRRGTKAPGAAGEIHTDFEKGFIRAEVIKFDDYIAAGSEAAVKEQGKMSVEGKDYVVQDADVIFFRFNV